MKLGIFIHWGVYSVPSFGSEWYWHGVKCSPDGPQANFQNRVYGKNFEYPEFAPQFKAELFDAAAWAKRRDEARVGVLDDRAAIWGSDREEGALIAARRNAARARVESRVELRQCAFHEAEPPGERGLVVVNPPYGQRVGHKSRVGAIYRDFGNAMKAGWSGWKLAILLPSARHSGALDLPVEEVAQFKNGSLPVHLFVGSIP